MNNLRSNKGFTIIELMIVVAIIGLLAAIAIPNFVNFQDKAKASHVKQNCHMVQLVAEDYSVQNDGVYASSLNSATDGGLTLVDLLPNGERLENPWTGLKTEPVDGSAASVGQTGYLSIRENGVPVGYSVDGYGRTETVLTVSSG